MVGGERTAFERAEDVFRTVAGNGTYGYLGKGGSGHMAKLVHNGIFYGIFPVYAEGIELLLGMRNSNPDKDFDVNEALRLLERSPPINTGIMKAISTAITNSRLPGSGPQMSVSEMVRWEIENADRLGVHLDITRAVLAKYASMSEESRKIYSAAKRIITSH
jgi:6-phosphogluconate dehydrogenase